MNSNPQDSKPDIFSPQPSVQTPPEEPVEPPEETPPDIPVETPQPPSETPPDAPAETPEPPNEVPPHGFVTLTLAGASYGSIQLLRSHNFTPPS